MCAGCAQTITLLQLLPRLTSEARVGETVAAEGRVEAAGAKLQEEGAEEERLVARLRRRGRQGVGERGAGVGGVVAYPMAAYLSSTSDPLQK